MTNKNNDLLEQPRFSLLTPRELFRTSIVTALLIGACLIALNPPRLALPGQPTVYLNGVIAEPGERLHVHNGESITFEPYEEPRTEVIAPYSLVGPDKYSREFIPPLDLIYTKQ